MPMRRQGFNDTLIDVRLLWLNGVSYPAPPASLYIALLAGQPFSDGSGSVTEVVRVGPVAFTSPATNAGDPGSSVGRTIRPTAPVSFTPPGQAGPGVSAGVAAWGLFSASSGGNPLYVGSLCAELLVGQATVLPASTFVVSASEP
jgi:hypothetical protein